MDKKAMTYKGLELVGYAGEARSFLIEALMNARKGKFDKVDDLIIIFYQHFFNSFW